MNIYFYLSLLVIPLAVWRTANMLADYNQHGPFCLLDKIRVIAGMHYDVLSNPVTEPGSLADGLTCVYCSSSWIGLVFTILFLASPTVAFYIALPFAFSTIAILIERIHSYE